MNDRREFKRRGAAQLSLNLRQLNNRLWTKQDIQQMTQNPQPGFTIDNRGRLQYDNKQVIAQEDVPQVLTSLLNDPEQRPSRDGLYQYIKTKYIGISRRAVMDFLRNSEAYQLTAPLPKTSTLRPIVTTDVSKVWQVDLMDVSKYSRQNYGIHFLLVILDLFSKYTFVVPLTDKTDLQVTEALTDILDNLPADKLPHAIQSDRGPEFVNDVFQGTLRDFNVKHILSKPYTPQSQGAVERLNLTLKRRIIQYMAQYQTKTYADNLPLFVRGYNNLIHTATGFAPEYLFWQATPADKQLAYKQLKKRATQRLTTRSLPPLLPGDYVRISLLTNKLERKNKLVRKRTRVNWSEELYQVISVSKPKEIYLQPLYTVRSSTGQTLRLNRDHLQKVDLAKLIKRTQFTLPAETVPSKRRTKPRIVYPLFK